MAKIERFEDIQAWQEARKLVFNIYPICRTIETKRDFSLADQIKRASVSIMANIAEGFGRKGSKEFARYLFIAKASATEVQSHLYVALDQEYISKEKFDELYNDLEKIQKMISGFIKYLNRL